MIIANCLRSIYINDFYIVQLFLTPIIFFVKAYHCQSEGRATTGMEGVVKEDIQIIMKRQTTENITTDIVCDERKSNNSTTTTTNISNSNNIGKKIDVKNIDLDEAMQNLPRINTWKYRPVFIQPAADAVVPGHDLN